MTVDQQIVQLHKVIQDSISDVIDSLGYIDKLEKAYDITPMVDTQLMSLSISFMGRILEHCTKTNDISLLNDVAMAMYGLVEKRRDVFGDIPLMNNNVIGNNND